MTARTPMQLPMQRTTSIESTVMLPLLRPLPELSQHSRLRCGPRRYRVADFSNCDRDIATRGFAVQAASIEAICEIDRRTQNIRKRVRDRFTALEQALSCKHLEQNDAKRPDIAAFVGRLAGSLFGRHIAGGSDDRAGVRRCQIHQARRCLCPNRESRPGRRNSPSGSPRWTGPGCWTTMPGW
jgi:hypothetical protein